MRYTEAGSASPRWVVVANGDNRRVGLFAAATEAAGHGTPRVVEWRDVLRDGGHDFADDELVRLDSPGENAEVDALLRGVDDPTRVEGSARWYGRFLEGVASLRGGRRLDDPVDLAVMFDKRLCHDRLFRAGVPVPPSPTSGGVAPVRDWADVRGLMEEAGLRRVFVKLAHGSSASGVLAIETNASGRIRATTSVERTEEGGLHNSLRVRRYTEEREIAAIVDSARSGRAAHRAVAAQGVARRPVGGPAHRGRGRPGHPCRRPHQPFPADESASGRGARRPGGRTGAGR